MTVRILRAEDKGDGAGGGTSSTALGNAGAKADETALGKAATGDSKTGDTKTDAGAKDAKTETKADTKDTKPPPFDYEKWAPKDIDGIRRPEAGVKAFREAGKKLALSGEQMQGLVEFDDARTKQLASEHRAGLTQRQKEWQETLRADKDIGGAKWSETVADLDRVMKKHGDDPELRKWFNDSGEGDRPELVRFIARIGKSMREDSLSGGTKGAAATAKKPTLIEQLYGAPKS